MFYEVVPEGRVEAPLTYGSDDKELVPGQIVLVPLMRRLVPGVVVKKVSQPDFETKQISKILYSVPLPQHLVKSLFFIHDYYLAPMGSTVSMVLPTGVQKKRRRTLKADNVDVDVDVDADVDVTPKTEQTLQQPEIRLNQAQKNAIVGLQEAPGATKLLFGVTGSGKTNIYLSEALNAVQRQKSAIILVPEIALTGQLVRVFREVFNEKVVVIHSKQTEAERHLIFEELLMSDASRVIIGPRSALFAPLHNLGLIIIDEEHESTYYQENTPKYSAIRVASFMASTLKISCILGSATPDISDYYIANKHNSLITLSEKAKTTAVKPELKIIDFKDKSAFLRSRYISNALFDAMERNLKQGWQTLLFHNRRGSSPLTICENCGEELLCPNCFLPLTLHADEYTLQCHTCGYKSTVPKCCPKCGHPDVLHKGFGTKVLENELRKLFPQATIMRFDADSKKGEALEDVYDAIHGGEVDILVGTQTIAKGLDLPRLATVGIVAADAGLALPDYAAEERVFQLITQVMGRVGRGHLDVAEVLVQSYRPDHPVIKYALDENYLDFADYLLNMRKKGGFPPYKYVARIEITLKTERLAISKVRKVAAELAQDRRLMVSPPMPAFHEHTNHGYTWELMVRAASRKALIDACRGLDKNFRVALDVPSIL